MSAAHETELDVDVWLTRLRWLGIAVPLASIIALHLLMEYVLLRIWPQHTTIIGWVIGAIGLAAFALAMLWLIDRGHRIIEAQNLARMEQARRLAVLEERDRIAREMHDSLAQVLGLSHLQLRAMAARPDTTPALRSEMDELAAVCHGAYADVREAILGLRQKVDGQRSLLEGLASHLQSFSRGSGLEARLVVEDDLDPQLSPAVEVQLIRVVQEALTNVRKHANARRVEVEVRRQAEMLRLSVTDDGDGFQTSSAVVGSTEGGFGLQTMRERTESVDGHLEVVSAPGRGTCVAVEVPERHHAAVSS